MSSEMKCSDVKSIKPTADFKYYITQLSISSLHLIDNEQHHGMDTSTYSLMKTKEIYDHY